MSGNRHTTFWAGKMLDIAVSSLCFVVRAPIQSYMGVEIGKTGATPSQGAAPLEIPLSRDLRSQESEGLWRLHRSIRSIQS